MSKPKPIQVVRTERGARMEQDGLILSEVRDSPGPTDSLFDVLAATIAALTPGLRTAILGFAAGGVVAPLRAMGYGHPLLAVDLSLEGERLFRELSDVWCGQVRVTKADAVAWLTRQKRPFDLILEDLSADVDGEITKPPVSLETLPALMAERLAPGGLVITNVLPVPGRSWKRLLPLLAAPHRSAHVIELDEWENRVLIAGARLPPARAVGDALRRHLDGLGSIEADALTVRTLKRRA